MSKRVKHNGARQPSGVNAVRVLELLVDYPEGLGISEVAQHLEMDAAQAHRLANGLRAAQYISKTTSRPPRYVVTSKVLSLAARMLDRTDLLRASRPVMLRLRDESGETVHLAAISEDRPVCVARELSHKRLSVLTRLGDVWPRKETAMGWVALAFGQTGEEAQQLDDDLRCRITEARTKGYAVDREVYVKSVVGVAAPVFDFHRQLVGALAVAGPSDRVPDDELESVAKLVLEGAKEISGSLGCRAIDALYHR